MFTADIKIKPNCRTIQISKKNNEQENRNKPVEQTGTSTKLHSRDPPIKVIASNLLPALFQYTRYSNGRKEQS